MFCLTFKLEKVKKKLKVYIKHNCPDLQKELLSIEEKLNNIQRRLSQVLFDVSLDIEEKRVLTEYRMLCQMELWK